MHTKFVTAAFAALAGAAILTGCQSPFASPEPDYEGLENYISDELNDRYPPVIATHLSGVECPRQAEALKPGDSLVCRVDLEGHTVRLEVAVTDTQFRFSALDAVYDLSTEADDLAEHISDKVDASVTLDCGEGLKVVPIGESFECTAADTSGDSATIRVTAGQTDDYLELLD